ncbi:HNH endonuclease signature motif containing protein [Corynebacterium freiburgense]|uniref:HNH endonuclease signature motif containing protein n=1 Tax=Corynebacterium freiburgense TaxID=556548 RepID=UPI000421ECAD|nr:HNH endonuclease signature motif containing protein [Corynebacterium freiburgense]WJZ03287.1 hypothetical protein CFREI_10065 [Corynebacterium freiburgense]
MSNFMVAYSDNPLAIRALEKNYNDIMDHIAQQPDLQVADCSMHAEKQAQLAQTSVAIERDWVLIIDMLLRHLPQFLEAALYYRHMTFYHLRGILKCTEHLGDDHEIWGELDAALAQHVQPIRDQQALPRPESIKRWVKNFLLAQSAKQTQKETTILAPSMQVKGTATPGMRRVEIVLPAAEATLFEQTIAKVDKDVCTAIMALVNGTAQNVKLELYGTVAPPEDLQPHYLAGAGVLQGKTALFESAEIIWRDAIAVAQECHEHYRPGAAIKRVLELRDGTCRFPGCEKPAEFCDKDHVIDYRSGGWTSLSNMQCLCRHHHNMKTGGRARCEIAVDGTCTWQIGDITTITTPQGPLAGIRGTSKGKTRRPGKHEPDGAKADRFRQTFAQEKRRRLKQYRKPRGR